MLSDERIAAASKLVCEAMVKSYWEDEDTQLEFSPKFEQRMERIINNIGKRRRQSVLKKIACVLLALLLGSGAYLMIDGEARAAVFSWIREQYESFTHYHFSGYTEDASNYEYELGWLPDGYEYDSEYNIQGTDMFVYTDISGSQITFMYLKNPDAANLELFLTDEDTEGKPVTFDGISAELYLSDTEDIPSCIVWEDSDTGHLFSIAGSLTENELIKAAEGVQKIKK